MANILFFSVICEWLVKSYFACCILEDFVVVSGFGGEGVND